MSSLKHVTREIERFLREDDPEAMCVSGEWGTGKTYTWERIYEKAVAAGYISKKRYSYASLFGISTLDMLKSTIFENTQVVVDPNNTDEDIAELLKTSDKLIKFAKTNKSLLASIPIVGKVLSEADRLYFSSVRNQLVCIDDLERRGTGLSVKDVLGLICFLKEQRKCKVILLLNDGQLGDGEKDFKENFEKVFDVSLRFMPTCEESADIVFNGDISFEKKLHENSTKLQIANIRVLSKIKLFGNLLQEAVGSMSDDIAAQAAASLTLFCFARFLPKAAPSIEYLLHGHLRGLMRTRETEVSEDEKNWRGTLSAFGFMSADDFDKEILSSIENGFFDADKIKALAEQLARNIEFTGSNSPLSKAWDFFRYSFDDNADEVAAAMVAGVADTKDVSPGNLDASVRLLKQIGRVDEAARIIEIYILQHATADARFWKLENHYAGDVSDPDVISAFESERERLAVPPDPKTVLLKIAERNGYNPEDIAYLAKLPIATFQDLIQNAKGEELLQIVGGGLFFSRLATPDKNTQELTEKIKEVLLTISETSALNALRIKNITGIALG